MFTTDPFEQPLFWNSFLNCKLHNPFDFDWLIDYSIYSWFKRVIFNWQCYVIIKTQTHRHTDTYVYTYVYIYDKGCVWKLILMSFTSMRWPNKACWRICCMLVNMSLCSSMFPWVSIKKMLIIVAGSIYDQNIIRNKIYVGQVDLMVSSLPNSDLKILCNYMACFKFICWVGSPICRPPAQNGFRLSTLFVEVFVELWNSLVGILSLGVIKSMMDRSILVIVS